MELKRRKSSPATLFSYVVDHDVGFAPDPYPNYCTLVHCKFGGTNGRRNIVEIADPGDWVIGTGGQSKNSAGHGKVIYLMRVDEKPSFKEYLSDRRFRGRADCKDFGHGNRFALVSQQYFYFGKNALDITLLPSELVEEGLVKRGVGFRSDYPAKKLQRLVEWFGCHYEVGMHGDPCGSAETSVKPHMSRECRICSD